MLCLDSRRLTMLVLGASMFALAAHAQTPTGRITGTVRSSGGTNLQGARVTTTNSGTGAIRGTTADASGAYTVAGLAPGAYTVTATLVGYRRALRAGVQVSGDVTTVDLTLEPLPLEGADGAEGGAAEGEAAA